MIKTKNREEKKVGASIASSIRKKTKRVRKKHMTTSRKTREKIFSMNYCEFCNADAMEKVGIERENFATYEKYCGIFNNHGKSATQQEFASSYMGEFTSTKAFAQFLFETNRPCYLVIPDILKPCINWSSVWERLLKYDYVWEQGIIFKVPM